MRTAWQFVEDLPEPITLLTRFDIAVGVCRCCGRRVQGRHAEQTSDALGAAAAQIGPRALATAAWLHKTCGMPLAKICALYANLVGHARGAGPGHGPPGRQGGRHL